MPGFYQPGEYDLAGFAVGAVKQDAVIDGKGIAAGDVVLGMKSSGVHSNGFSLVRKVGLFLFFVLVLCVVVCNICDLVSNNPSPPKQICGSTRSAGGHQKTMFFSKQVLMHFINFVLGDRWLSLS